jgi:ribosome-associated translation inhibitor RaiA
MAIPVEITFLGMARSPALEAAVARWVKRLEHSYPRILNCHVRISLPHRHRRRGAPFDVKLVLAIPGDELVVTQEQAHSDVYLALADAFIAARRELRDRARIRRGGIKQHAMNTADQHP